MSRLDAMEAAHTQLWTIRSQVAVLAELLTIAPHQPHDVPAVLNGVVASLDRVAEGLSRELGDRVTI